MVSVEGEGEVVRRRMDIGSYSTNLRGRRSLCNVPRAIACRTFGIDIIVLAESRGVVLRSFSDIFSGVRVKEQIRVVS